MKEAVLVIDMIYDFVYGKLGGEGARSIIPDLENLLQEAEEHNVPAIFCQDSHVSSDPEMDVWGQHAMKGEEGVETVEELEKYKGILVNKRFYNAFFDSSLYTILRQNDIERVVLTGVSTDICIQNTAAGAFFRGFDVVVVEDCTAAISEDKHDYALDYMESIYGAEIMSSENVIEGWGE